MIAAAVVGVASSDELAPLPTLSPTSMLLSAAKRPLVGTEATGGGCVVPRNEGARSATSDVGDKGAPISAIGKMCRASAGDSGDIVDAL